MGRNGEEIHGGLLQCCCSAKHHFSTKSGWVVAHLAHPLAPPLLTQACSHTIELGPSHLTTLGSITHVDGKVHAEVVDADVGEEARDG
jgi:hypothetical protein